VTLPTNEDKEFMGSMTGFAATMTKALIQGTAGLQPFPVV
jgi:hypothetical protein